MNKIYAIFSDYFYLPKRYLTNELFESIDRCSATEIDTPNFLYFGEEESYRIFKSLFQHI